MGSEMCIRDSDLLVLDILCMMGMTIGVQHVTNFATVLCRLLRSMSGFALPDVLDMSASDDLFSGFYRAHCALCASHGRPALSRQEFNDQYAKAVNA